MRCSEVAQCKHNPAARRSARSLRERRVESICMGSGTGGPEVGKTHWGVASSLSQAARCCEMREACCMKLSSPMLSS